MEYNIGDRLNVDGGIYQVTGKILYRNLNDNFKWFEYKIVSEQSGYERWLSYDFAYNEYSISEVVGYADMNGYHEVDNGTELVEGAWGDVDVEVGDRAVFVEYEDSTEEYIISYEQWEDMNEWSRGYYLDSNEVTLVSRNSASNPYVSNYNFPNQNTGNLKPKVGLVKVVMMFTMIISAFFGIKSVYGGLTNTSVLKYLKKSSSYEYVTSITGSTSKDADVYKSGLTLDGTARDIINAIDGKTESVQQNNEDDDKSIAILTKKEYCYIYISEDNEVLVQISSREYAYANDSSLYHSNDYSDRYYRRYYYSRGYTSDSTTYDTYSPYSSYDDTTINSNSSDIYSSYASSVRQASVSSRNSSGGGTSSGK